MPRALDIKQIQPTHDPTRSGTEFHMQGLIKDEAEILAELLGMVGESFTNTVINVLEELLGIDLSAVSALLEEMSLDFTSPTAFLTSLVHAIEVLPEVLITLLTTLITELVSGSGEEQLNALLFAIIELLVSLPSLLFDLATALLEAGAGLLGFNSPLNALNLFNIIPTNVLGMLNFSSIGESFSNLITDPLFQVADAFTDLLGWDHFAGLGHSGTGAAQATADGTTHELLGNLIPASLGQVMNFSGWTKWTGLLGTGNPIALAVTGYDDAGTAVSQATVDDHSTTPGTTDWLNLAGTYTVPAGVTGVRTRLLVGSGATAGTVWWDDMSATKTQTMFQRLIAGTDPGDTLTNDIENLFGGIITNALGLLTKAAQGDFDDLVSTIIGDVQEGFEDVGDRLNDFLHSLSPLNGSNILSGNVADDFVEGVRTTVNNIFSGLFGLDIGGATHDDALSALRANAHALTDHGAGISQMYARMSQLESMFAALPVSAGGTGSGNADGGLVGAIDTDGFERTSSSNLGSLWTQSYSGGAGVWATPNGHDATWNSSGNDTREFLCIRSNPDILRSQTDYQRVTMELSSKATRDRDLLGFYDYCGTNDIWLRISDASTSLSNITGYRIRWEGDGALSIRRYISGSATTLASLGTGGIVPPGPGAQLIGEAGVLADGARLYIRAKIGESIRLGVNDTGATNYGAAYRRWGHGGRAQGASLFVGQTKPGGVHFWNGMDQTTS